MLGGITMARDAVPLRILVTRERVTVTGLVMEDRMMVTGAVGGIWCAGPTTARSLDTIIMKRMTAAKSQCK